MVHQDAGSDVLLLMGLVKGLIGLLGAVITYFALKAYLRTRNRSLGLLTAGFGFVTLGAVLGGLLFELLEVNLATGILVEGIFMCLGFALVALSLRA